MIGQREDISRVEGSGSFAFINDAGMAPHPRLHPRNPRKLSQPNKRLTYCLYKAFQFHRHGKAFAIDPFNIRIRARKGGEQPQGPKGGFLNRSENPTTGYPKHQTISQRRQP
jgi:hypothetical protein